MRDGARQLREPQGGGPVWTHAPPAPRVRRVSRWFWLAAWVIYSVGLGALYIRLPANPDSAVFDYIGWMALKGSRLYIDVGEQNFPGQMWLQMASTALFGNHVWSFRLFDFVLTTVGAGALLALLLRAKARLAALAVVPLYQAMIANAGIWMSGQRDVTAALFLVAAGLAYVIHRERRRWGWLTLFSVLVVGAVLIRPTYAVFAPLLLTGELLSAIGDRPRLRAAVLDALGAAAIALALAATVFFTFWRTGALAAWYDLAIRFNVEIYSQSATIGDVTRSLLSMWGSWHWYVVFASCGAAMWWRDDRDRAIGLTVAAVAVTAVVSGYVQRKGFGYHFAGLFPVLAFFAAYLIARSIEQVRARFTPMRVALAVIVCGVALVGTAKKIWSGRRPQLEFYAGRLSERALLAGYEAGLPGFSDADALDAATYARNTTQPEDAVLTWSRAVQVNFLSERRSPTRFATVGMLSLAREPFSLARAWTQELSRTFQRCPPVLVLVPAPGKGGQTEVWREPSPSGPTRVLRHALESQYVHERSFGTMDVYRLRVGRGSTPACDPPRAS
jgi:hypothetical protein